MKALILTSTLIQSMVDEHKQFTFPTLNLQTFNDGGDGGSDGGSGDEGGQGGTGADNGGAGGSDGGEGGDDDDNGQDDPGDTGKTFSQKDVNAIAAREAKRAQEKIMKQLGFENIDDAKAAIEAHKQYLESQKTEQQKKDEQFKLVEKQNKALLKEKSNLEAQVAAMKAGVKTDSMEDAITLARRLVNDETTLEDAMKTVVEKYPSFAETKVDNSGGKPKFSAGEHKGGKELSEEEKFAQAFAGIVPNYGIKK